MARAVAEVVTPSDLDGLPDGTTRKAMSDTEKTKLTGIEENAEANIGEEFTTAEQTKLTGVEDSATADQTGTEIQTAVEGLADADRKIMVSDPQSGEYKVYGAHRNAAGNLEYDYEDQAES